MVTISSLPESSPAYKSGVRAGDILVSINGEPINDVLDYRFYAADRRLTLAVLRDGSMLSFSVRKGEYEELGPVFDTYLMDKKKTCRNKCVFCFIDQNPPGMRESIYFKDDDERLSFLQGNYITLTNLSDTDIDRIIRMRIMPVNVSVHSMNPETRCKLTGNRFAGEKLRYLERLSDAGTELNLQFVICRGINDGDDLRASLREASKLASLVSASVVPTGLTKFRDGLYPLEAFDAASAAAVIDITEEANRESKASTGEGRFFCSDEFYLLAGRELPDSAYYEGYPQYENGVGMLTDLKESFALALEDAENPVLTETHIATGEAAYPTINALAEAFSRRFPASSVTVHKIINNFYGETVTVSGLITGADYIEQLSGKVGGRLLISRSSLNSDGTLFLDGVTPGELEKALGVRLFAVGEDGGELCGLLCKE